MDSDQMDPEDLDPEDLDPEDLDDLDHRPAILLVEDDAVLGPLIVELIEDDFLVDLARNGQEGLHLALSGAWDALVVDRGLPVMDGITLISALRAQGLDTPILILTALGSVEDKVAGLDAGANDYMTKPFDAAELKARLRALTRSYASVPALLSVGNWDLDVNARLVRSVHGERVSLTAKETEMFALFAQSPDHVFSREELMTALFQPTEQPGVIDTYVHHLRRKISRTIVRTVHGVGYQAGAGDD
ncbi:response regulator transcription factor [Psychromicrobium xiongbiense]|uniref:response regulator transcription factor n=1 Tax=Psychromicrobium xiongbiense TaxID=3051184 RepID=UPI0025541FF2|nr:response regulator transcription factor [Psychromicrobium sp. YIM S02556]